MLDLKLKNLLAGSLEYYLSLNSRSEPWKINELIFYLSTNKMIQDLSRAKYLSLVDFTRGYSQILYDDENSTSISNRSVAFVKSVLLLVRNGLYIEPYPAAKISKYFTPDFKVRSTDSDFIEKMENKYLLPKENIVYDRIAIESELRKTTSLESFDFK